MEMPLSTIEISYQDIQSASAYIDPIPPQIEQFDHLITSMWASDSSLSMDFLDTVLQSDEAILEAITSPKRPWGDMHHKSYFLSVLSRVENGDFKLTMTKGENWSMNPLATHVVYAKGNMDNIFDIVLINISRNPRVVENVFTGVECSPDEVCIYTNIFK